MLWIVLIISSLLGISVRQVVICHNQSKCIAHVGGTAILNCSTLLHSANNSTTYSNIKWYKFGQPLADVTYRSISTVFVRGSHMLRLDNVLSADSGLYECKSDSEMEAPSENNTFHLCIKGMWNYISSKTFITRVFNSLHLNE